MKKKFSVWLCHKIWHDKIADLAQENEWSWAMIWIFIIYMFGLITLSYVATDLSEKLRAKLWQKVRDEIKANEVVVTEREEEFKEWKSEE